MRRACNTALYNFAMPQLGSTMSLCLPLCVVNFGTPTAPQFVRYGGAAGGAPASYSRESYSDAPWGWQWRQDGGSFEWYTALGSQQRGVLFQVAKNVPCK